MNDLKLLTYFLEFFFEFIDGIKSEDSHFDGHELPIPTPDEIRQNIIKQVKDERTLKIRNNILKLTQLKGDSSSRLHAAHLPIDITNQIHNYIAENEIYRSAP